MIIKSLYIGIAIFSIVSCTKKVTNVPISKDSLNSIKKEISESHNANNSLDYIGNYEGVLPCADCSGIETKLNLIDSENYTLYSKYLDTDDKGSAIKGTYSWNKEGKTIILSGITDAPNKYFVGENQIFMLDMEGKRVEGQLAKNYILKKKLKSNSLQFVKKYKLIELRGNPIKNDYFIQFEKSDRFSAFAGCNSIGGEYKVTNVYRISFLRVISTQMACEDMKTEQEFSKMLEMTDNFNVDGKILSLNKGRMTPLARFELIK